MNKVIIFLISFFFLNISQSAMAIETPDYTVKMSHNNYEIRSYPSMLVAEVTVMGNRDQASTRGFRKLAAYIFGDNISSESISMTSPVGQKKVSEKIAMTSPVLQKQEKKGQWIVNFMMPEKYSKKSLPIPMDNDIRIMQTAPYSTVSIRFSGSASKRNLKDHQNKLDEFLLSRKINTMGEPEYAFYDAPFVPPMFRRNEIHYRIFESSN